MTEPTELRADLVLEGGGLKGHVKGLGLVGAVLRLSALSTLVYGAVLSNFPIALFDRTDNRRPRWPTFGVRLSARPEGRPHTQPVTGPVSLVLAIVETMLESCDAMHMDDPCLQRRSLFIDTSGVSPVDFGISEDQQEALLAAGREAAETFLDEWDFAAYVAACRGGAR